MGKEEIKQLRLELKKLDIEEGKKRLELKIEQLKDEKDTRKFEHMGLISTMIPQFILLATAFFSLIEVSLTLYELDVISLSNLVLPGVLVIGIFILLFMILYCEYKYARSCLTDRRGYVLNPKKRGVMEIGEKIQEAYTYLIGDGEEAKK